jgi:hypothetical protein
VEGAVNVGFPQGDKERKLHCDWKYAVRMDWTVDGFREWAAKHPPQEEVPAVYEGEECPF